MQNITGIQIPCIWTSTLIWTLCKNQTIYIGPWHAWSQILTKLHMCGWYHQKIRKRLSVLTSRPGCYGNHGRLLSLENRANFVKTNTLSSHFYSKYKRYISKMILYFQKLELSLDKINIHFGTSIPIFRQQQGKIGQNWHFANFAKSVEIWWFCGDITKIAPLLGLKFVF